MPIRPLRGKPIPSHPAFVYANRFVVLFRAEGSYRKLFSIQFERRDNGLGYYVHLPYFAHTRGILSTISINGAGPRRYSLRPTGTTTTEKLKYTHHPDGEAHFSQDGKVYTRVRTQTTPLHHYEQHLFTVNFWGVEHFELAQAKDLKDPKPDRAAVRFDPEDLTLPASQYAGRIVGSRYTMPPGGIEVANKVAARGSILEPVAFRRWDGSFDHGIPLFPVLHQDDEFFIVLTYLVMDRSSGHAHESLMLMGGLHEPQGKAGPLNGIIVHNTDHDPDEWAALVQERGTIDLPPGFRRA